VDASGGAGGGEVLVGGDYLGKNPNVPNAKATVMGSEAKITADATANGDGGRVILWSDEYTGFYGDISAQGGISGGNGGFVETSSKINLQAFGNVDASASNGNGGLWLLDPLNVQIIASGTGTLDAQNTFVPVAGNANISPATIEATLQVLTGGHEVAAERGLRVLVVCAPEWRDGARFQDLTHDGRLTREDPVKGVHRIDGKLGIIRRAEEGDVMTPEFFRYRGNRFSFYRLAVVGSVGSDHDPSFAVPLSDDGLVLGVEQVDLETGIVAHTREGPLVDELPVDHSLIQNYF
jgi:hypothetical protein